MVPPRPTRISAATECTRDQYMMYNDSVQLTGLQIRRSADPPLIPSVPPDCRRSGPERRAHGARQASNSRAHMRPRASASASAVGPVRAATAPPQPLLEDVVVAAEGNSNIPSRRHMETTYTRNGPKHVTRKQTMARAVGDGGILCTDHVPAQYMRRFLLCGRCLPSATAL